MLKTFVAIIGTLLIAELIYNIFVYRHGSSVSSLQCCGGTGPKDYGCKIHPESCCPDYKINCTNLYLIVSIITFIADKYIIKDCD
ncbi:hypothetical protein ACTXT7_007209 [Hymenolepis weldensis]